MSPKIFWYLGYRDGWGCLTLRITSTRSPGSTSGVDVPQRSTWRGLRGNLRLIDGRSGVPACLPGTNLIFVTRWGLRWINMSSNLLSQKEGRKGVCCPTGSMGVLSTKIYFLNCKLLQHLGTSCPVGLETSSRILKVYPTLLALSRKLKENSKLSGYFFTFLDWF